MWACICYISCCKMKRIIIRFVKYELDYDAFTIILYGNSDYVSVILGRESFAEVELGILLMDRYLG